MKDVVFHEACEARFVYAEGEEPKPLNDIAKQQARKIAGGEIPDADKQFSVWKVPRGAEMSIPDKDAEKLGQLVGAAGQQPREEKPTEYNVEKANSERTSREEAEKQAAEAGHTVEGKIIDTDKHAIAASQQATRSANQPLPQR
jgi:hypothetical protein